MRYALILFLFNLIIASVAYGEVVVEGVDGYWLDTPEGPDVMEKDKDHQLWIPDRVSIRVSDQDIVFMSSTPRVSKQKKYRKMKKIKTYSEGESSHEDFISFLKNWGNSCPGDLEKEKVLPNRVRDFSYQSLEKIFRENNPDIFFFQYKNTHQKFNDQKWKAFLAQIPRDKGCVLVAPEADRGHLQENQDYSRVLESFVRNSNHHCQVIHREGGLGVQDLKRGICDRDYRVNMGRNYNYTNPSK